MHMSFFLPLLRMGEPGSTFKNCPQWKSQQKTLGATVLEETRKLPGPTRARDRTNIAELLAAERVQPGGARFPCDNRRRSDGRPTGGNRGR